MDVSVTARWNRSGGEVMFSSVGVPYGCERRSLHVVQCLVDSDVADTSPVLCRAHFEVSLKLSRSDANAWVDKLAHVISSSILQRKPQKPTKSTVAY